MIAYLKYAPSHEGKWGRDGRRFRRTMSAYTIPEVLCNVEMLRARFPQYVFQSRVLNIRMSAVPRSLIVRHYRPGKRLMELAASHNRDELEADTVDFVSYLSDRSGINLNTFGVTGSILTEIHQPNFSDMDVTVYGLENTIKVKNALMREYQKSNSDIRLPQGLVRQRMLDQWAGHYRLQPKEAAWFGSRKWNRGSFRGRAFSLLPVHSPEEVSEKYGDREYRSEGIVEGEAAIAGNRDSFFLPSTYGLADVKISSNHQGIEEITSYDGFYSDIFQPCDIVRFRGKLEKMVERQSGRARWRILIGSPEAEGLDYIKPKHAGDSAQSTVIDHEG